MDNSISGRIEVICGDITAVPVDAIVNAANSALAGGGGVDGAIHRAAGPGLLEACRSIGGCPTGEVRMTGAFDLPAQAVIHAVGPIWDGGDDGEPALLASCYREALYLADDEGFGSISFPAISCGVYGYPRDDAATVALDAIACVLPDCPNVQRVVLVAYDDEMAEIYEDLLSEL